MTVDVDTESIITMHELDPKLIQEVLEFSADIGIHAQIYVNDVVIFEKPSPFADKYINRHSLPYEIDPDIRKKTFHHVPKILAFSEVERQDEMLEAYRARFLGKAQVSRSMPGYIEINCLNTTKGTALEELAGSLNIAQADVAAVGDNYLDQEMIEWAGTGVCVANGAESVKAVADLVIPDCDDDGVAYFIEHYVL
jgi:hydroxymethylpyrimidine pyrophosphatase-like HAD family hydrolase